jgi:hypothetical protein
LICISPNPIRPSFDFQDLFRRKELVGHLKHVRSGAAQRFQKLGKPMFMRRQALRQTFFDAFIERFPPLFENVGDRIGPGLLDAGF